MLFLLELDFNSSIVFLFLKDDSQLVRNCLSGHVYDSGPLDFTSDLNAKFALHPTIRQMSVPSRLVSWVAKGVSSGLEGLYLTRFESQRSEYWQALYSSVVSIPSLIISSQVGSFKIFNFPFVFSRKLELHISFYAPIMTNLLLTK